MNAVVIEHFSKRFKLHWRRGEVRAVDDLSLTICRGEIFGLLGPNGSGKTTTMKAILGLIRPSSGTIAVAGEPAGSMAAKAKIGFLPENPYFPQFLTAREILNYYGALCGMEKKHLRARADELLKTVRLEHAADRPLRGFSKGMLQRIGLAQALLHEPEILLLDEPTAGVDPLGTRQIKELILELKRQGKTIIFSTHLLGDVQETADRIAVLHLGRKRCEGELEELLRISEQTQILAENLDESAAREVGDWLAQRGAVNVCVSKPHRKLEDFFAELITPQGGEK